MAVFEGKRSERVVKLDSRYSVSDAGLVYSDGLPLEAIEGVGVNLHGKRVKIAYLVARAFVANSECRQYVRHKNGDVKDNRAENLEWCDEKEEKRRGRKPSVCWVKARGLDGELRGVWSNVSDAAKEMGVKPAAIRGCLMGRQRKAGGLLWELA